MSGVISGQGGPRGGAACPAGTAGYGEAAEELAVQYESVSFEQVHRGVLHLLPAPPARVADIGAGTGRDAAALAALGHRVVAVEPTAELRRAGRRLHAGSAVDWNPAALPGLDGLAGPFDLLLLTAVWMHLDAQERAAGMRRLAGLLAPGGLLVMSVRHGPVPEGRRMFAVPDEETEALAADCGLAVVHRGHRADLHGRGAVRWSEFALRRPAAADG